MIKIEQVTTLRLRRTAELEEPPSANRGAAVAGPASVQPEVVPTRSTRPLHDAGMYHQHRYAHALLRCLSPGTRWLDLGAGTRIHGGWLEPTPETLSSIAQPLGCDPVFRHLRAHPHLSGRIGAIGDHLPFASASFDLVSANMVLEHLANPIAVFAEVARVLAPGGRCVFVTPHRCHWVVALFALLFPPKARQFLARVEGRDPRRIFLTHYLANTRDALERLALLVGLELSLEVFASWPAGRGLEAMAFNLARLGPGSNLLAVMLKPGPVVRARVFRRALGWPHAERRLAANNRPLVEA